MHVTSTAYQDGAAIPSKYTCDGADVTPPWNLHDIPDDAAALAAAFTDADAPGTWAHWLAWDIDPGERAWLEGTTGTGLGTVGENSWGNQSYGGPCPPEGATHRYVLTVYALDEELGLPAGTDLHTFQQALGGHVLAVAKLKGTYGRT